jgi:hypothetical protein
MHAMRQRSWILIAIDCSRPIAGQMSALDRLAKIKRKYLMPHRDTHDHRKFLRPRILTECVLFSDEIYEHAGGLADQTSVIKELDEYSAKWRVIAFDALGPISIQNKKLLSLLADAHKSCVTFRQPIPGSFWRQLPNRNINGTASNGGNYLKALLCLAELNHLIGTIGDLPDSNRIMAAIPQQLSHRDPANAWRRDFAENIEEKYIRQANDLIDGGYKWLIHAQKPDPSVKRQASPVRTRPNPLHHNRGVRKGWEE